MMIIKKPTLYLMVGLPRSGKSTIARDSGHPVVCPDEIRRALGCYPFDPTREREVWWIARVMVEALFGSGARTVILDATNIKRKDRDTWKDARWVRVYQTLDTSPTECKQRALMNGQAYLLPVIDRMASAYESVADEEWDGDREVTP